MNEKQKGQLRALRLFFDTDVVSECLPPCTQMFERMDCEEQNVGDPCQSCKTHIAWRVFTDHLERL